MLKSIADLHDRHEGVVPVPVLVSFSGGKDSAWMVQRLREDASFAPVALLTTLTEGLDRVAMQGIRREVLQAQAASIGLPLVESWQPHMPDNDTYEALFGRALTEARARFPGLRHIAFGDLFLEDIRAWRDALCARFNWQAIYPLFGSETGTLARTMITGGLRATLCCVDTDQMPVEFAGSAFDSELLSDLPDGVDPCGEQGEFHTCVYDGPMFSTPLALEQTGDDIVDGRFAYCDLSLGASAT